MDWLRLSFTVIWVLLTAVITGFVLWRKFKHERVDFEDMVIDRCLLAAVAGLVAGRICYVLLHLPTFGWALGKWLAIGSMPGIVDTVSLVVGLIVLWSSLGKEWKDPVEIMDYSSIGAAFFLFLVSIGDVLLQIINSLLITLSGKQTGVPAFDLSLFSVSVVASLLFLLLFIFLSRIEKKYRTFLWYRAKRRSAQTGFVLSSFLIAYGLIGITLGWFLPSNLSLAGLNLDPILKLLVGLSGIVILYVRSGRRA